MISKVKGFAKFFGIGNSKITVENAVDRVNGIGKAKGAVENVVDKVNGIGKAKGTVEQKGFEKSEGEPILAGPPAPQIVSPQERIARSIEERKTAAEVTILDRTGTAEVTDSTMGASLRLVQTGAI